MTKITKVLVANRGEIAARIIRTARDLDIATVAVFSDADAAAPYVRAADESVHLPGTTATDTYLRADLLVAAAQRAGADAVHPGYGFLSENAAFARACQQAGLVFVGPPADVIETMGSKLTARDLMAKAGVPVLPGAAVGDGTDPAELAAAAEAAGYPVLVKAAFGGGGRGMRIVTEPGELAGAVAAARREAAAAFGDPAVFLEHCLEAPRHIEVQLIADTHGQVAHLFERECSIQRRYQKIIEEAPSPAVGPQLREALGAAAVAAGRACGYTGVGTVEFVLDSGGRFWFLEMNTRLQVEHPVTEAITGLDLVALQFAVAEGAPLPAEVSAATISGHAIEARLYAEDPAAGFQPASGTLHRFEVPARPGLRTDAGVASGSVVTSHYDALLAKVIAHGADRDQAARRLAAALAGARLHGLTTNRDLLTAILREPQFRAGQTDTGYLTRHDPATLARSVRAPGARALHALAAALAGQAARRGAAPVLATLPCGWRNVPSQPQETGFRVDGETVTVRYRLAGPAPWASVDGDEVAGLVIWSVGPDRADLEVAGVRRTVRLDRDGDTWFAASALGTDELAELPRFAGPAPAAASAGSLLAPLPGTVVTVAVTVGDQVRQGDPVLVLEAMKMEHPLAAPHDGVVTEIRAGAGQAVPAGAVLAVVEPPPGAAGDGT
jgi:propionyl-CoA carboxylase alpha chain